MEWLRRGKSHGIVPGGRSIVAERGGKRPPLVSTLSVAGAGAWSIELKRIRAILEERQIAAYFASIALGAMAGFLIPNPAVLESGINPALALMLFVTFLQVPISELRIALRNTRFLAALLVTNFIAMPIVTALLIQLLPNDPMLQLVA